MKVWLVVQEDHDSGDPQPPRAFSTETKAKEFVAKDFHEYVSETIRLWVNSPEPPPTDTLIQVSDSWRWEAKNEDGELVYSWEIVELEVG